MKTVEEMKKEEQERLNTMNLTEEKFSLWNLIKEAWKNKRYRSILILFFWFVFLFAIAGGVRNTKTPVVSSEEQEVPKTALEVFRDMDNYEFSSHLSWTEFETNTIKERKLNGSRVQYQEIFENLETKTNYYVDNGIIYKKNDNGLETTQEEFLEITLKPDMAYRLLDAATLEATTNYKDGTILKTYTISLKKFIAIYHSSKSNKEGTITMTTKEKNNQIIEVSYDLLDFMNMTEAKYSGYGLAITYSNIGKAKEIHMQ